MSGRIVAHPEIHFGKPCVAGTRIPVQNELELVREGIPFPDIVRDDYPDLSIEDVRSCVQYADSQRSVGRVGQVCNAECAETAESRTLHLLRGLSVSAL